jgi:hypothetical protein
VVGAQAVCEHGRRLGQFLRLVFRREYRSAVLVGDPTTKLHQFDCSNKQYFEMPQSPGSDRMHLMPGGIPVRFEVAAFLAAASDRQGWSGLVSANHSARYSSSAVNPR